MAIDTPTEHYDRVTEAWGYLLGEDLHYGLFENAEIDLPAATRALSERMARHCRPAGALLDVGCGTGGPARWLVERYDVEVTGISTSRVGIESARAKSAGVPRVRFEVRDAQDTKLPNASFDRVWVMESPHLMPDKAAMLSEASRLLRPRGRLVLCDIIVHRRLPLTEVLRYAREFDLLRRVFGRAKMETLAFYAEHLEANGLAVEVVEDLSVATRPTFDRWRENADQHRRAVESRMGEAGWKNFRDSCDVLDRMWDERRLGYGLVAAHRPA